MSKSQSVQRVLAQAKEKEKRYDWVGAVEFHKKALGQMLKQRDLWKAGEIEERIGYCFHRAAMQAESQEEFRERLHLAIEEYEKAHGFYEKLGHEQKATMLRCRAVAKYLGYWLTSEASEKRRFLDECLELEKNALMTFLKLGNMLEYGRTYNELWPVFFFRGYLEWDKQILKSLVEKGMEWGEKAVAVLSELDNSYEVARAYFTFATCLTFIGSIDPLGIYIVEPEEMEKNRLKVIKCLSKAVDLSEKVGDAFLLGLSHLWLGFNMGRGLAPKHYEKALECGKLTRDKFLIGASLDILAYDTYMKAWETEDPDQRWKLEEDAMEFYDKAQHHNSITSFQSPRSGTIVPPGGYAEYYLGRAKYRETDPQKKLEFLEKAEKAGLEALKPAEDSDIPRVICNMLHYLSKILEERARIEPDPMEKRSRLEKALEYREKTIEIDQAQPSSYFDKGVFLSYLAEIKAKLADTEPDLDSKNRLLEEAVLSKEKCLKLCNKMIPYYEKVGNMEAFRTLQGFQDGYATLLTRFYDLTNQPEHLRRAIMILQKAIESARKLDMISLIAESYWKIARAQDILKEPMEAAENFERASESYMKAAGKIPQLKDFYQDHASYMQAWNEIEKAKNYHAKKQYGQAKEHYEKAANLHKSTGRWNYLSPNYLAWARLEQAEDLSRREQTEEARDLFQKAAELFAKAKKSIGAKLEKIEVRDEKEMADELAKASEIRHEYCLGRIALEEAKILDRMGDHTESSKKYGLGAKIFEKMAKGESELSRKELQPIIYLCQAWQKMMIAEAKTSSKSYGEAAELFKQAKEHTLDQPTSLLALANSSFCKALAAGTEFEITRDMKMYSTTKKHVEAAENYYLKAGFETASEYAKATLMLFDAYMYITKAETETNTEKKAQYYKMAEKLLQTSAGAYIKAKHPEKSEEVQRLLENIKEKRQLAVSLTKVLHVPTITATTTSFSTPTPTHEKAVGLERFEHADIQANLTASEEVTVEERMEVKLDLVNVAKESGLLIRVDNLIPPSFKVTAPPSQYSIEDGSIDLKGKRLEPLKVESVKLSLQATKTGVIDLRPQITYVDDVGNFRKCMPEPTTITVHPKLTFKFKTGATRKVFDYLSKSFVEDYMRRRLTIQEAGWRSFVQIIRNAKVSSRSVYGSRGHHGSAISELEMRGLIETRIFLGERGRGGKIVKTRISYEKETVKRLVDQKVAKNE
jgi:hypothetical protein